MDQWTRRPSADPRAIKGSPEATEQAAELFSIQNYVGTPSKTKRPPMPLIADIAATRSPSAIALLHGKVLRGIYQVNHEGRHQGGKIPGPDVQGYLVQIVRYLCEIRAGILMREEPFHFGADGIAAARLGAPSHFRDAKVALHMLLGHDPSPKNYKAIPHQEILGIYLDNGYFSDAPGEQIALPSSYYPSWIDAAVQECNPYAIKALLDRGVDLDARLTEEVIERTRATLTVKDGDARRYITKHYEGLEQVRPGDFLAFFRVCGTPVEHPLCREVVRSLEARQMARQIDLAAAGIAADAADRSPSVSVRRQVRI